MVEEQRSQRYTIFLAILLLFSSSISPSAQNVNYNSIAYLPASWTHQDYDSMMTPILQRESDGPSYVCGFYCNSGDGDGGCLFGVLIAQGPLNTGGYLRSSELVWSANRNNLVQSNAKLQLKEDGDLVFANIDGTLIWSSNTRGKSVSGLNLTEMGNLVLFGPNNESIWQSFDHPTDSLLLGQKLAPGQKLTASVSASNWSEGRLSLGVGSDGLSAYIQSDPPQRYYASGINSYPYYEFRNGSFNDFTIPPASVAQFMKFGPDGHLKVYQWGAGGFIEVIDLLNPYVGDCGYPMVCGKYGVCSKGQCGCIETTNGQQSYFSQIMSRQPDLGCSPITPISCDHSQDHTLLELNNTSYFASDSSLDSITRVMEDCKSKCLSSCSCKAALFYHDRYLWDRGDCFLLNEVFSMINNENYIGSPYNTTLLVKVQKANTSSRKTIILASTFGAFFGMVCLIGSCLVLLRRIFKEADEFEGDFLNQVPGMPIRYSYENLKAMTEDFKKRLGEGGFGSVYEGELYNGTKIAVKCLDGLAQLKDSFLAEVQIIGSIHHVNLVKLTGFCFENSHRLLVYEHMASGSLDRWIFGEMRSYSLPWRTRRKIISDIAKGLAYLHEDCSQRIIHFDIKPQNILLDENFNAKVADFGLSKLIEKDQSRVVTRMRGTPGYLAPEWLSSTVTEKVDVYSFGIVMLEILCGRKNFDSSKIEEDRHLLSIFKRKAEEERLEDMVDRKSADMLIHVEEAMEMMRIAAWCLQGNVNNRPSMSLVVKALEGLVVAETNLDYDFTNSSTVRTEAAGDHQGQVVVDVGSPILPSTLSGPR
ncbi:G-type lectin S-receptor-like serine/threonine-protein kinase SD2-5 [Coffea eugenioides]|uniref:G-type lectin S-receptor-like serine/threonine-protein kinase SD2-5 n=1 Tax=Coffea eugenioides TaxID=49369 RepID=UPI000F60DC96|nr:G-type lectin S-receptor-like serine/threonine-protein kinase SD2-5 [Coffea eugenioides]